MITRAAPTPPPRNDAVASANAVSVVTLVSDEALYQQSRGTLAEQLDADCVQWLAVRPNALGWNAAQALNHAISAAVSPWIVCAHQDVLFPAGWWSCVTRALRAWPGRVAVAGLVGVRADGHFVGHVLDPHGHCRWLPLPSAVCSIDEHVIILHREAGLRFDVANPGFHCYGTDIALTARSRGWDVIVIDAPVVHMSGGKLDSSFERAAAWLLTKWGATLGHVIPTCATTIEARRWTNVFRRLRVRWNRRRSRRARSCGGGCFGSTSAP